MVSQYSYQNFPRHYGKKILGSAPGPAVLNPPNVGSLATFNTVPPVVVTPSLTPDRERRNMERKEGRGWCHKPNTDPTVALTSKMWLKKKTLGFYLIHVGGLLTCMSVCMCA